MINVVQEAGLSYPEKGEWFSPSEAFPEYKFKHLSAKPNRVYALVRELLAGAELDKERYGTPDWNPLGTAIKPGASVFVLCNFVHHSRVFENEYDFKSKCTHGSVLRALLDYVLIAVGASTCVRFGNAPVQSCNWEQVLAETGAADVVDFYARQGRAVQATDLRLVVRERDILKRVVHLERRAEDTGVEVDLGRQSWLADLARGTRTPRLRVSDYDPRRIEAFHAAGSHRYVISTAILNSDVVVSLPKLKTHSKVGITCALKGFVGTVAHKDCLAHYRFGSPQIGGDEYPKSFGVLHGASHFHDWVNTREQSAPLQTFMQMADGNVRRLYGRVVSGTGGAWHGNDTAWRMTLDLAGIVRFADRGGIMHDEAQRTHLSLIDGIIAGEGNGPLKPVGVDAGALLFSDDVALGDRVACRLMGFDPARLPLLAHAFEGRYPSSSSGEEVEVRYRGKPTRERDLPTLLRRPFAPPPGWRNDL